MSETSETKQHTPGPWTLATLREVCEAVANTLPDLDPTHPLGPSETTVADARLMAAAPDLLEALRYYADGGCGCAAGCSHCDAARAAIARAEGGEL